MYKPRFKTYFKLKIIGQYCPLTIIVFKCISYTWLEMSPVYSACEDLIYILQIFWGMGPIWGCPRCIVLRGIEIVNGQYNFHSHSITFSKDHTFHALTNLFRICEVTHPDFTRHVDKSPIFKGHSTKVKSLT